jgi:ABC-type antimicrobial peptide transport system permease subunit
MRRGLRASFVLRRMGSCRLLLGSVLLAVFITAALTAALVTFGERALPQGVSRQLHTASLSITISGQIDAAQAAADSAVIRSSMRTAFAAVPVRVQRALWSDPLGLPATGSRQTIQLTEAAAPDQIMSNAVLVSGAWPGPPARGKPIPAALPAATAAQLHLAPGELLTVPDRDTGAPVTFRLTGTFRPRDPASPYWGLDLVGTSGVSVKGNFVTYGPLIVSPAAFSGGGLPVGQASWLAVPAASRIQAGDISGLAARISQAEDRLRQPGPLGGLTVVTGIPQLLTGMASNLVVARSLLIISMLQLVLLAAAAITLAGRMLASQREEESALLSARGVTRWQLARLTLAEAVLLTAAAAVAGTLAGSWLARPLARAGLLHAAPLRISGLASSAWWTAAAILGLCTAIMLWPALRPAPPAAARIRRGRQAKVAGAAQAGADLAVIALGLLAGWQLRSYSAVARSASGGIGIDPVLVAAPALALAGAALIPLRLLPTVASAADRLSARTRRLGGALASWQVSRRPIRQSGPVLLMVLAVATGTLALAQQASWQQGARDQAAFAVGSDIRVDLGAPVPLSQVAAIQHAPGVRSSMPVASFNGGTGGTVIALDARQAPAVVALRPDASALPLAALWKKITPARAGPGLVLPGRPARLELTASARPRSAGGTLGPMSVTLSIQDAAGIGYAVAAGRLPVDGRGHQLIAMLSAARAASYPLRLLGISLSYRLPALPAPPAGPPAATAAARAAADAAARRAADRIAARRAVLTLSALAAAPSATGRFAAFATASALRAWHAAAGSQDLADPHATGSAPLVTGWQAAPAGARTVTFGPGDGYVIQKAGYPPLPISGRLTLTAGVPSGAPVLPAIATQAFLSANRAAIGSALFVAAGPVNVPVKIVAAITDFPTMGAGSALIIDQAALQEVLAARSAAPLPVTAWWLRTAGGQAGPAPAGLPAGATMTGRAALAAALLANPLSAAPQQGVLAIGAAAALLAVLGFSVSVAASLRERRTQSALLAALGVSRTAQALQLCLEELMLSVPAAAAGLLLGAGLAHLLIPAMTLTASAAAPVPPALIYLPLGWAAGLAVVVTAIPVLAAAATVARRPDPAAQLRAAEAV